MKKHTGILRITALVLVATMLMLLSPRIAAQPFWSPESPLSMPLPILPKPAQATRVVHPWPGCAPFPDGAARCISRAR
jgi:hypothetical protein